LMDWSNLHGTSSKCCHGRLAHEIDVLTLWARQRGKLEGAAGACVDDLLIHDILVSPRFFLLVLCLTVNGMNANHR